MKIKSLLALVVGCLGLLLLVKVQQGQEIKKRPDLSHAFYFEFDQQELRRLIQDSWYNVLHVLVEKGFLDKDENCNDYRVQWTEYPSDGPSITQKVEKNLADEPAMVKELISSTVDAALKEKGSLVIKNLSTHVLGKNALNLFGVSLKRMMFMALMENFEKRRVFSWCGCVPAPERITVSMNVVNDVSKLYVPQNTLRYTAIATGGLLQDYSILQELKARGFKSIKVNVIDPVYLSPANLKQLKDAVLLSERDKKHVDYLDATNKMNEVRLEVGESWLGTEDSLALEEFTKRLKEDGAAIEVVAWEDTYDYIARAKKYPAEKSDIILLIDAGGGYFELDNYPSLANVILIASKGKEDRPVRIYLSEHGDPEIYVCDEEDTATEVYKKVSKVVTEFIARKKKSGEKLPLESALVPHLIEKFGDDVTFTMKFAVDLYSLLQDMLYECIADPKKTIVYADDIPLTQQEIKKGFTNESASDEQLDEHDYSVNVIKINPLVYRKKNVRKDHLLKQCLQEKELKQWEEANARAEEQRQWSIENQPELGTYQQ